MPLLTGPGRCVDDRTVPGVAVESAECPSGELVDGQTTAAAEDRKSTRLNSSHSQISYAVFCLKKKKSQSTPLSEHASHRAYAREYRPRAVLGLAYHIHPNGSCAVPGHNGPNQCPLSPRREAY